MAADITYCPMEQGFVYLVAIMDWYTRKYKIAQAIACFVLSWRVSTSMDAAFCVEALQEAISRWEGSGLMAMFTYKTAQAVACFGQAVYSVLQMPQGDSYGLLLDPSSVPSVGLPSDQCQILSLRGSDGMRLITADSGPNYRVHFSLSDPRRRSNS